MTHRSYNAEPEPSPTINPHPHQHHHSSKEQSLSHDSDHFDIANMVEGKTVMHILEILGVFICAHHFWPKGITYGEAEEWETKHRMKHAHSKSSKSKSSKSRNGSTSHGSSSDGRRQMREDRFRDYDEPRYSRRSSARY